MTLEKFAPLMDFAALERVLHTWASKSTGLEVVFAEDENAPQPDRPYVALDISTISDVTGRLQIDEYDETSDKVIRAVASMQLVDVGADVFTQSTKPYENAMRYVDALVTACDSDAYREELFAPASIAYLGVSDAEKVPLLEDDVRWRSRAQARFRFSVASNLSNAESFDYIASVALTGTVTGGVTDPLTAATSVSATG